MEGRKIELLFYIILLLSLPQTVGGGYISWVYYLTCITTVGVGGAALGSAVLPLLGFTSGGIAAGSWAASLMAAYGGVVPAGSLFAFLQSAGATGFAGFTWSAFGGISGFCAALTFPFT